MAFIEILKAIFIGVIQGVTEWLPVSSTGHMIIFDEIVKLNVSENFMEMFRVVIQFGSILAVLILFWRRLIPFGKSKSENKKTWNLWIKIIIAAIPAAIIGLLFDEILDKYLYNYITVAITLIVYGIAFIVIERLQKNKACRINSAEEFTSKSALQVGAFQLLSLIPGTSRSGSTILGGMCVGVSRTAAAEFSFFLAIPVMLGASALKILKYVMDFGLNFSTTEIVVLVVGTLTAFLVSLIAIKFLMGFVRRHSFESFGWYRIALGIAVIAYAIFTK